MSNSSKVMQPPPPDANRSGDKASLHDDNEASWGDKWKHSLFKFGTYTFINYFINTLVSAAVSYHIERRGDKHLTAIASVAGKAVAKFTGFSEARQIEGFKNASRAVTLSMGGTALLPVLKALEDNRNAVEFKIGHGLDVLQDTLGRANGATRENLAEYKSIKTAIETHKPVEGLSGKAMGLIGKQHGLQVTRDGKLAFDEEKLPWSHAIVARITAWSAVAATNYALTFVGLKAALTATQGRITSGISRVIPAYKKMADPDLFSANLANDAILTISGAVTQPFIQKLLKDKKSRSALAKSTVQECAPLKQDDNQSVDDPQKWAAQMPDSRTSPDKLKSVEGYMAQVEKSKAAANDHAFAIRA